MGEITKTQIPGKNFEITEATKSQINVKSKDARNVEKPSEGEDIDGNPLPG